MISIKMAVIEKKYTEKNKYTEINIHKETKIKKQTNTQKYIANLLKIDREII